MFEAYRSEDFPLTVVRPSHTYDRTKIAMVGGWTDVHRMRAGLPVMVHGDGTSLWTLTHSRDFAKAFVGLLGRPQAVGESYTITSDEYLPWNQIYRLFARAAGVPEPELVHVASETIASHSPELGANLLGDRSHSVVFDNTKIKSLVPGYTATIPFADGAREIVDWYDAHPVLQVVDQQFMDLSDRLTGWARSDAERNVQVKRPSLAGAFAGEAERDVLAEGNRVVAGVEPGHEDAVPCAGRQRLQVPDGRVEALLDLAGAVHPQFDVFSSGGVHSASGFLVGTVMEGNAGLAGDTRGVNDADGPGRDVGRAADGFA